MKVDVDGKKIKDIVALATRFSNKQAHLEVLRGVLLIAEGDTLTIRATNLESGIEVSMPASVKESGLSVVSGSTLFGLIASLPDLKMVSIVGSGSTIDIATQKTSSRIKTLPPGDFPTLPTVSGEHTLTISASDFSKLLRSVAYCASVSSIKPELQSVCMYIENNMLFCVATDSFRLAERTMKVSGEDTQKLLLPIRSVAELIRILERESGKVELYWSENQLSVRTKDTYFTTRLIDGMFPNYKPLLPTSFTTEVVALREDLLQALKTVSVFSDANAQVHIEISPKKKECVISAANQDIGEHAAKIESTVSGENIDMYFNGRYIADALANTGGDSVRLGFNGGGKPLALHPTHDQQFVYIVMPMNR